MAEAANAQIEEMVPELHDLVHAGIFSRDEVREIVNRRKVVPAAAATPLAAADDPTAGV